MNNSSPFIILEEDVEGVVSSLNDVLDLVHGYHVDLMSFLSEQLNVTDLKITFYYRDSGGNWQETANANWNSTANSIANFDTNGNAKNPDGLPDAIAIELTVQEPNLENPEEKDLYTFSTLIYIPQAK